MYFLKVNVNSGTGSGALCFMISLSVQGFFQKISQEGAKPGFGEIWGGKVESNNMP